MAKTKLNKGYLAVSGGTIDGYFRTIKEATQYGAETIYEVSAAWEVSQVNRLKSKPLDEEFEEDEEDEDEDEEE